MTISTKQEKRMDWHLVWTALSVIVPLGGMILGCFASLSKDIQVVDQRLSAVDQRLSKLEGSFEERGKWESKRFAYADPQRSAIKE